MGHLYILVEIIVNKLTGLPTAWQVPRALQRKLDDLMNELAYIDHFPERWGDQQEARVLRRVSVLHMMAEIRSQLVNGAWAMPIELSEPADTEAA